MNLKLSKYLIFFLIIVSCENQSIELKNYGYAKNGDKSSTVTLKISEFKNYGMLVDRIQDITCSDSIPKIVIRKKKILPETYSQLNIVSQWFLIQMANTTLHLEMESHMSGRLSSK